MNNDRLTELETLIAVADRGSFTAAAKSLGVTQSAISRRISSLEERLAGKKLVARTTRHTEITEVGERYLRIARAAVDQLRLAEQVVLEDEYRPEGLVRVSLPPAFGRSLLVPALHELCQTHPKLRFDIDLSGRFTDFIEDHIDMAVRTRPVEQSGTKSKRLAVTPLVAVASPKSKRSALRQLIVKSPQSNAAQARIEQVLNLLNISTVAPIQSDSVECILDLTVCGHGVTVLPRLIVEGELKARRLVIIKEELDLPEISLYAQYPYELERSAKLQTTLDALKQAVRSA